MLRMDDKLSSTSICCLYGNPKMRARASMITIFAFALLTGIIILINHGLNNEQQIIEINVVHHNDFANHSIAINESNSLNESQSSRSSMAPITQQECSSLVNEKNIQFLPNKEPLRHEHPSYLFSYGGSGNTVTRTILEYITNIWTASIYGDRELIRFGYKGETQSCSNKDKTDRPVILIKAHPEYMDRMRDLPSNFMRRCLGKKPGFYRNAPNGNIPEHYKFVTAVFIVRDPWKSMFTLFQFKNGQSVGLKDDGSEMAESRHIRRVMLSQWNQTRTKKLWVDWVRDEAEMWSRTIGFMKLMDGLNENEEGRNKTGYVVVKYENVISRDDSVAMEEIDNVLQFLYSDSFYGKMKDTFWKRMQCIFGEFGLMRNDTGRFGTMHRKPANSSIHLTFDVAYQYLVDNHMEMMCAAWYHIKDIAVMYSYQMLWGLDCELLSGNGTFGIDQAVNVSDTLEPKTFDSQKTLLSKQ